MQLLTAEWIDANDKSASAEPPPMRLPGCNRSRCIRATDWTAGAV